DEACCRRTNADNQVERLFGKESLQVLNEWPLRVLIAGTGAHQRVLGDIQWPRRLPFQLRADQLGVFAPGLKITSERMKQHHTLGLGRKSYGAGKRHHKKERKSRGLPTTPYIEANGHPVDRLSRAARPGKSKRSS